MTIQFLWLWCDQYNCFRFQCCNKSPINTLRLNTARWYLTPSACKKLRDTGAKKELKITLPGQLSFHQILVFLFT